MEWRTRICAASLICATLPFVAHAGNSVYVESKTVVAGARDVQVGVYVENVPPLKTMYLPFEFRSLTPGSFIADTIALRTAGRLATQRWSRIESYFSVPSDTMSCYYEQRYADFVSSNMVLYMGYTLFPSEFPCLAGGSDGLPPTGTPSLVFHFDVSSVPGTFIIDSTCYYHENFRMWECDGPIMFAPKFTPGVITIVPCTCGCQGNPICDGVRNMLDVTAIIGEAFQGQPAMRDASCGRNTRCDLNCDCEVTVADVVAMIDVSVRGVDPTLRICDGCADRCPRR
jgi:hypothetical protein